MDVYRQHVNAPLIVSVIVDPNVKIRIDKTIRILNQNGRHTLLKVCGLIYFEDYHFVARIIDADGNIWYNDGKSNGRLSSNDGTLQSISNNNILQRGTQKLIATVYAQM